MKKTIAIAAASAVLASAVTLSSIALFSNLAARGVEDSDGSIILPAESGLPSIFAEIPPTTLPAVIADFYFDEDDSLRLFVSRLSSFTVWRFPRPSRAIALLDSLSWADGMPEGEFVISGSDTFEIRRRE